MPTLFTQCRGTNVRAASLDASQRFDASTARSARTAFAGWPAFADTPLLRQDDLAGALGIEALFLKDERARLGLDSFKGLGGAYAVFTLAAQSQGIDPGDPDALAAFIAGPRRQAAFHSAPLTVTTATAGNHGRSVAAGAWLMGLDCVIFVYNGVPCEQIDAIAAYGARIVEVDGVYEDAVELCRATAEQEGWQIVSDTSWEGYSDIPLRIMEGYTLMAAEAIAAMPEAPTHVFLQAGVGGMAAAVAAHLALHYGSAAPRLIVIEPDRAACIFASIEAGELVTVSSTEPTNMGRLECYTPSLVAWRILRGLADAVATVSDEEAAAAVARLEAAGIETSPSGAAGVAGLMALLDSGLGNDIGLDRQSRVLAFITERRPAPPSPAEETAAAVAAGAFTDSAENVASR